MKPQEFWNSNYREARLYVESQSLQYEMDKKAFIVLANNLGDKLINASMVAKNPTRLNLIRECYPELFKEEIKKDDILHRKASEGEDLINLMLDISQELKEQNEKKNDEESQN